MWATAHPQPLQTQSRVLKRNSDPPLSLLVKPRGGTTCLCKGETQNREQRYPYRKDAVLWLEKVPEAAHNKALQISGVGKEFAPVSHQKTHPRWASPSRIGEALKHAWVAGPFQENRWDTRKGVDPPLEEGNAEREELHIFRTFVSCVLRHLHSRSGFRAAAGRSGSVGRPLKAACDQDSLGYCVT